MDSSEQVQCERHKACMGKILTWKRYYGWRDRKTRWLWQKSQPAPTVVKAAWGTPKKYLQRRDHASIHKQQQWWRLNHNLAFYPKRESARCKWWVAAQVRTPITHCISSLLPHTWHLISSSSSPFTFIQVCSTSLQDIVPVQVATKWDSNITSPCNHP